MATLCQWRIIKCDHCSEPHPECKMKDHIEQCSKFPVSCPSNCGGSFSREMTPSHIKDDCPLTMISCPYEQMGCETKVQREHVEAHLQSALRLHLDLACVKLNKTENKLNDTDARLLETKVELNDTKDELNDTKTELNDTKTELNDTKAKLNDTYTKLIATNVQLDVTNLRLNDTKVNLTDTQKKLETTTKLMEEFDTRMFIWKIDNFSEILRQAKTGEKSTIKSAPFYTDRKEGYGYKLKVRIDPNGVGSGKNTHLSVFIIVMKGEYDAILPWPFKKKVTFTVIDQQEDPQKQENVTAQFIPGDYPEYYAKPVKKENTGHGFRQFISHEKLNLRRYLVEDTLFLQVDISP